MSGRSTNRTASLTALAIAACVYAVATPAQLPAGAEPVPEGHFLLQVTPAGTFMPADGRDMDSPPWNIGAAGAQRVIAKAAARLNPAVIDYEHQTLHKEANGQPAPAAGWIRGLRWIEGHGLFAVTELTARARSLIAHREYLYFSPVFEYSRKTGEVLDIHMGALTNNPAIHGMQPLSESLLAAASAAFLPRQTPEPSMNPLLAALLAALGLPATTTEEAATAALTAVGPITTLKAQAEAARTALGLAADATPDAVVAACSSLRATATPDPAKFVPAAIVTDLQSRLAVLTAQVNEGEVGRQIDAAMADGRLQAGEMETYARKLGKDSGIAALTGFLSVLKPNPALVATQTGGKVPPGVTATGELSATELAVCTAMGLTPEKYRAGAAAAT